MTAHREVAANWLHRSKLSPAGQLFRRAADVHTMYADRELKLLITLGEWMPSTRKQEIPQLQIVRFGGRYTPPDLEKLIPEERETFEALLRKSGGVSDGFVPAIRDGVSGTRTYLPESAGIRPLVMDGVSTREQLQAALGRQDYEAGNDDAIEAEVLPVPELQRSTIEAEVMPSASAGVAQDQPKAKPKRTPCACGWLDCPDCGGRLEQPAQQEPASTKAKPASVGFSRIDRWA